MLTDARAFYRRFRTPVLVAVGVVVVLTAFLRAPTAQQFFTFTILGVAAGSIYALAAAGVVLTYTTTGVFNFAHGAIGMICAFLFWQLSVQNHWVSPLALAVVLLAVTPLMGLLLELLFRRFRDADVSQSVVLTVAITVLCIGVAQKAFGTQAHLLPRLLGDHNVTILGATITWDNVLQILVAVAVAIGLRLLLFTSRTGTAMRAVVDNANLAALNGASPVTTARVSWILGAEMAAGAGILFGAGQNLEAITLTFFVVNAYGAAVFGKLRSLPLTFAGGLLLGVVEQWCKVFVFPKGNHVFEQVGNSLAGVFLFVALLALPQAKLSVGRVVGRMAPRVPSMPSSVVRAVVFVGVAIAVSPFLGNIGVDASRAMVYSVLMLSVVVLTGFSGQISLAQYVFLAIGAWSAAVVGATPFGFLAAAFFAVPLGLVMALPALRLQGLYLALVTFGFASISRELIIQNSRIFGSGARLVDAPSFLGLRFDTYGKQFVLGAVVFAALSILVLAIKRGPFGRRLSALRDSQAACVTLGLDTRRTKLAVFCLSAAIAGSAGFLFGVLLGSVSDVPFEKEQNIVLLLFAVVGGVTTVTGALLGGVLFALVPYVQAEYPQLAGIPFVLIAAVAIGLGRQPNGLAGIVYAGLDRVGIRWPTRAPVAVAPAGPAPEVARAAA